MVRDVEALESPQTREARALTDGECRAWLTILDESADAQAADLPDLVRFLLGTGCRIGEALALTWPHVDLERHLVHIEATLIRVKGQGLLMKRPKTKSGVRVLRLPLWLVGILPERRARDPESAGAVSRTRWADTVTRATSSGITASCGLAHRSPGSWRTPTTKPWQRCSTSRVSALARSPTSWATRGSL
jgi:integrase